MNASKMTPELIALIDERNAATEAWVAQDPSNRYASTIVTDPEFWVEQGILTVDAFLRDELISHIWDIYKDINGVRPRFMNFDDMSTAALKEMAEQLEKEYEHQAEAEKVELDARIQAFKDVLGVYIQAGARDEDQAIEWILSSETLWSINDIEDVVSGFGILYTDYGRELVERMAGLAVYEGH